MGLGVDVLVATGIRRAGPGLIADVAGSAALLIALTVNCFGQGASDFTKTIDPLFAGVLAHPGNLGNTIQYAAASANRGVQHITAATSSESWSRSSHRSANPTTAAASRCRAKNPMRAGRGRPRLSQSAAAAAEAAVLVALMIELSRHAIG